MIVAPVTVRVPVMDAFCVTDRLPALVVVSPVLPRIRALALVEPRDIVPVVPVPDLVPVSNDMFPELELVPVLASPVTKVMSPDRAEIPPTAPVMTLIPAESSVPLLLVCILRTDPVAPLNCMLLLMFNIPAAPIDMLPPLVIPTAPASELPIFTAPVEVPVLIFVAKLDEALRFMVAPVTVRPSWPVRS